MSEKKAGRFGTFGGVFTPSVLTILGVIMFMRAGHVVGDVGIWQALIILLIAKTITTLTTLSVSAIATNTEIGPGGNYFMISRTLGAEVGGTIGLTLFVSQAVAISFYVIGFTDALVLVIGESSPETMDWMIQNYIDKAISCGTILLLFGLTFKGADLALKAQYFILVVLLASVAVFLIGGFISFDSAVFDKNTVAHPSSGGFWVAFAIFFPAATGIDAGANMSGDLKDPGKSIPSGTLLAIGFTASVYVLLLFLLAGYKPADGLIGQESFGALKSMSIFPPLVVAGVFAACLSSALSSFLGAPRILQAMGKDKIIGPVEYFGVGHGPDDEPRRGTILSLVIALVIPFAGGLDAIAEIISMFFLIAYGMINFSAFVEGKAGNPSFRPRFKLFGWPAAMAGAVGCAVAMIKINETYAIIATVLAGLIYLSLKGRSKGDIGDATRGYTFSKLRDNLFELNQKEVDAKNWRPQMVAITQDADRDIRMLRAASWLESHRGFLSVLETKDKDAIARDEGHQGDYEGSDFVPSEEWRRTVSHWSAMRKQELEDLLSRSHIEALPHVACCPTPTHLATAIDAHRFGPLAPNTYMATLPPPNSQPRRQWLYHLMRQIEPLGTNIILYKGAKELPDSRQLDLWWHGDRNGSLMAIYSHLLRQHQDWSKGSTRISRLVRTGEEKIVAEQELKDLMAAARLKTEINIVLSSEPIGEVIAEQSANAGMVFLGLSKESVTNFERYTESSHDLLAALPPSMLFYASGKIDLMA